MAKIRQGILIDLYLDGDLGVWALEQVPDYHIANIITNDKLVADRARARQLKVMEGKVKPTDFSPSTIGFSVHYKRILKPEVISKYQKIYNLHPGYLPWGRGYYPIFWALWEQTPAGATLHEITEGIDEGPIIAQKRVEYSLYETGGDLFLRVREAEKSLFTEYFGKIISGETLPSSAQPVGGTYHSRKEFLMLKKHLDWKSLSTNDMIRLIRYLTFPGYSGLEIEIEDKRYEVILKEYSLPENI
jgi:methionyl-tRNA formyltransferase